MSERLEHELRCRHRAVAALLGFAVGDAYGVAAGRGEQPFGGTHAEVSDATQMMLACCEGLLRTFVRARVGHKMPVVQDMVWHAVARWGAEQGDMDLSSETRDAASQPAWLSEQPIMRARNRHGSAAAKALAHGPRSTSSAGSAALYRVAPMSLCIAPFDPSAVRSVVALTHDTQEAMLAAVALHRIVHETFVSEHALRERVHFVAQRVTDEPGGAELGAALLHAITTAPFSVPRSMPAHTAQGTLVRAVHAAVRPESLPAVLSSVTAGHTHDVIALAAIAGLLASLELARGLEPKEGSTYYEFGSGTQLVPPAWRDRLVGRGVVERIAADLLQIRFKDVRVDADIAARYPGI